MLDEPFRWMEAVATRHSYIREKLQKGQPVLGVPYNEGALLVGFAPQPGKIYEIYDRIALGGLGHPADVERLRMTLLEMAHLEGFNRSASDVNLLRLLQFGIAPALKQNFEEVQRAPYLIQLLLAELKPSGEAAFYRLNYDGYWETFPKGLAIAGDATVMDWITDEINQTDFAGMSLQEALKEALRLWEAGRKHSAELNNDHEWDDAIPYTLKDAFEKWNLEAAVLSRTTPRKALFRRLDEKEIESVRAEALK